MGAGDEEASGAGERLTDDAADDDGDDGAGKGKEWSEGWGEDKRTERRREGEEKIKIRERGDEEAKRGT